MYARPLPHAPASIPADITLVIPTRFPTYEAHIEPPTNENNFVFVGGSNARQAETVLDSS